MFQNRLLCKSGTIVPVDVIPVDSLELANNILNNIIQLQEIWAPDLKLSPHLQRLAGSTDIDGYYCMYIIKSAAVL